MSKVVLFAASLLLVAGIASAGIIDPCAGDVTYNGTEPVCYFACPQGDTDAFYLQGFWWSFTIVDLVGATKATLNAVFGVWPLPENGKDTAYRWLKV